MMIQGLKKLVAILLIGTSGGMATEATPISSLSKENVLVLVSSKQPVKDPGLALARDPQTHANPHIPPIQATMQEANLRPHRATYALRLDKAHDPDIASVDGTMTIEILDNGDGWTYEHRANMVIRDQDGNEDNVIIKIASWESKDGNAYRFNSFVVRNGEQEQVISGVASRQENGDFLASYTSPERVSVSLSQETVFPLHHLELLMRDAVQGKRIHTAQIFDGTSELRDTVSINTVITPMPKPNVTYSDQVPFPVDHVWLMHMAIYGQDNERNGPEPDYEISYKSLPHGLIAGMTLNFGDFDAQLTLTELEIFTHA